MYGFAYLIVGALSGIASGLLGIGGGIFIVPALFLLFSLQGFPQENLMSMAVATSLASMFITTAASTYFHNQKKVVAWKLVLSATPGVLLGAGCGAVIATSLPTSLLQKVFGGLCCIIGFYLAKHAKASTKKHKLPRIFPLNFISLGVASLSSMLGIGGGLFAHPFLTYSGFTLPKAVGTSSAFSCLVSLYGTLAYYANGDSATAVDGSLGYIYLPAFFTIGIASSICARQGATLAHKLSPITVKRVFAVTLVVIGVFMLLR